MLEAGRHLRGRARPDASRRCSTSSATTSRSKATWRSATSTTSFAKADRVVRASIEVHRHEPVPMECRGLIADWDAAAEHLTIHAVDPVAAHVPDAAAAADQRADGADPGARGRRRRWVRAQERRGPRGRRRRGRVHRPRAPGEVDRGPARAPGLRRAGTRGEGRHRGGRHRRRRPARAPDGRHAEHGRLRLRPVPRRDLRDVAQRLVPGPHQDRGASPRTTPRSSATRRRTSRTAGRGRPATSCASACSTSSRASSGSTRSTSAAATTCTAGEPPLAMLTGQPFVGVTTQQCVEQAATVVDWDGFRRRQAQAHGRRAATSGSASRRTSRRRPDPRCRAQQGNAILGDEVTHISVEDDGDRPDHHPPAAARPGPRDDPRPGRGRRARRQVRGRPRASSATPTSRRWRWSAPAAAGPPPWRTASCSTGRGS